MRRSAFSLVELSIVLVILGLLVGGILAGQSLIRAAELRSVGAEYARYQTAVNAFRDKYFAIPGDMANATAVWQRMVNAAHCVTNSAAAVNTGTGVCDGDGSGLLSGAGAASQSGEVFQFWRQLAASGLIEGTYSGLAGSGGVLECSIGTNCPASRLSTGGWSMRYLGNFTSGQANFWTANYGNYMHFGAQFTTWPTQGGLLAPEEAWNIDTKLDDGLPGRGAILGQNHGSYQDCSTATTATDYAATYRLTSANKLCWFAFPRFI